MKRPFWRLSLISLGIALCVVGDVTAQRDTGPLSDLAFLEGSWAGEIDGTIGPSTGERVYRFIIGDRFLLMQHDRNPGEPAATGDVYEEWAIFSFDPERGAIVLRELLLEGLVNTYMCEIESGPTGLTCASDATEGGGRLVLELRYEFVDADHFTELFEIVGADGTMQVQMEGRWRRTSDANF